MSDILSMRFAFCINISKIYLNNSAVGNWLLSDTEFTENSPQDIPVNFDIAGDAS